MIKVALIGAGKMGISHLSILGAHHDVEVVGVADTSKMVLDVFKKYSSFQVYTDYEEMIEKAKPEAVFVAVPTKYHAPIVKNLLLKGKHVFAEKPLCLSTEEGKDLVELAARKGLINQVGYHNEFIGTFREVKRIIDGGYLGDIFHFTGEAYGPVVVRPKQNNWRSDPAEGGGCLLDYASHVVDLINYILGPVTRVKGTILKSFYSKNVEDSVFTLLELSSKVSGVLSVNWSDDTYRKMSTSITIIGSQGKIICDASELKVHFKTSDCPDNYTKGWNVKYITDLTQSVDFYLRGEEYSDQVDYFIKAIQKKVPNTINNFESAWKTDQAISLIKNNIN
ncbi:Gfo/Idh/MocA family oxidoreductase [Ilyomonas limi]|uniref:Gfo/Idh/MocA family oxidoreductase n=1 Tax=Ilyomonas limi TaxID=2575867 RepID=A0A4U3L5W4_9BACT|nr:Gfo/Idh/MocA family oxidoreductase [Ilyomonas limi]TKK70342.1 Gfo/Idh/MocA family oxidoreductase [Ilyomonas limi]